MSDLAVRYLNAVVALLERVRDEETPRIGEAAEAVAAALADGRRLFAFGCSHSSLVVQDIVYRAGGLMLVNPLYGPGVAAVDTRPATLGTALERLPGYATALLDNAPVRSGDVLIVVSVSGRNAVPVEMAAVARERGLTVVGVTSRAYDGLPSRHPSGRKLADLAHFVLDTKVDEGDAVLAADGVPQRICAASGVTGAALLHALVAAVVERLLARGLTPPVFRSANVDGGMEWNARLLAENADRIFYLD